MSCRLKRRMARRRWWWRLWFRITVFFKRQVLLQKNVMDDTTMSRRDSRAVSPALRVSQMPPSDDARNAWGGACLSR